MTDLIKRLRRGNNGQEIEAADRIEELEAKLAKAVEALRETDGAIMFHTDETSWRAWGEDVISDIRKVLAELEGEPLGAEFEAVWDANKGELYEP